MRRYGAAVLLILLPLKLAQLTTWAPGRVEAGIGLGLVAPGLGLWMIGRRRLAVLRTSFAPGAVVLASLAVDIAAGLLLNVFASLTASSFAFTLAGVASGCGVVELALAVRSRHTAASRHRVTWERPPTSATWAAGLAGLLLVAAVGLSAVSSDDQVRNDRIVGLGLVGGATDQFTVTVTCDRCGPRDLVVDVTRPGTPPLEVTVPPGQVDGWHLPVTAPAGLSAVVTDGTGRTIAGPVSRGG